jgi:hypothetical protein
MMNPLNMYIQQAVMMHYHWLHYTAVVHKGLINNTKKITKLVKFFMLWASVKFVILAQSKLIQAILWLFSRSQP